MNSANFEHVLDAVIDILNSGVQGNGKLYFSVQVYAKVFGIFSKLYKC